MKALCSSFAAAMSGSRRRLLTAPLALALWGLAACNGTAVVTLTSTPSQDFFLAYRVQLVSVQLQTSSTGKANLTVLPTSTTVDLAKLADVSEILGAAAVAKGSYTSAVIKVDYSNAQIVYDDGSVNGLALTAVDANGQALGQVQLTVDLDPADSFSVASNKASRLALDFKLAASNAVNAAAKTVTVTPMIAASAMPIDTKPVRIRGPLVSVGASQTSFTTGVMPFDGTVSGAGQLLISPTAATTYEVNGIAATGGAGITNLAGLAVGALTVSYGTLTAASDITTASDGTTTTSTNVSFAATQVLAGGSVQGDGLDRVSGIVSARSGNTLTVEDATLVAVDGTETFLGGTTAVNIGGNTAVTVFGQGTQEIDSPQQISVGSSIDAFGTISSISSSNALLDASAGRVRIGTTDASGLVTSLGNGILSINLATLGGRPVGVFDFVGSGATPGQYSVSTGTLDLTNAAAQAPVVATGAPNSFGASSPNFIASSLLDPTTIQAQLVIDWGAGTATPFTTFDGSAIDLDIRNSSIGLRHQIQVGAQLINIAALSSDPLIAPDPTASTTVFAIGHAASSTVENFNTYDAFITQLQAELNGTNLATGMTVSGHYTASTFSFSATGITLFLND